MRMVVMPRMAYTRQEANLSEAQIKRLDKVTLAYAWNDLRLLAGFPTVPLIHHQLINHPLPSSVYYEARLGSLWRNIGRGGCPAAITQGHLERANVHPRNGLISGPINADTGYVPARRWELLDQRATPRPRALQSLPLQRWRPHARVPYETTTTHKRRHRTNCTSATSCGNKYMGRPINSTRDHHAGVRSMFSRNLHSTGGNRNSAAAFPAETILVQN